MKRQFLTIAFFTIYSLLSLYGNERLLFRHFSSQNSSLSGDNVNCLYQDSRNYIWCGSNRGLNRFDGIDFETYMYMDLNLQSDYIHTIMEDNNGKIWVGTNTGVSVYDYESDAFTAFRRQSNIGTAINNKANQIVKDKNGLLWISVNGQGLFSYDTDKDVLNNYFVRKDSDGRDSLILSKNIHYFTLDNNGKLWISLYYKGLYYSDTEVDDIRPFLLADGTEYFKNDEIESLAISYDANHIIYVLSVEHGLSSVNVKNKTVSSLLDLPDNAYPLGMNVEVGKCIWINTTNGVFIYDLISGESIKLNSYNDSFNNNQLDYITALHLGKNNGLWLASKDFGLYYSEHNHKNFKTYQHLDKKTMEYSIVTGFTDDLEGNLWITTMNNGLLRYSIAEEKVTESYSVNDRTFNAPLYDNGIVWLGSYTGVSAMDVKTGKIKKYATQPEVSSVRNDNFCQVIFKTDSGEIFAGTTLGLFKYNRNLDKFEGIKSFEGIFVRDIGESGDGFLWIATNADGLYVFDPEKSMIVRNFNSPDNLPANGINDVFIDNKDRIWILLSSHGLYKYEKEAGKFVSRPMIDKLGHSAVNVFAINDDCNGNIWLSTNYGILRYNESKDNVAIYDKKDGIEDKYFKKASIRLKNGTLFFSTMKGFISFMPQDFDILSPASKISITDFYIGNNLVKPCEGGILEKNIDLTTKIELRPNQSYFSFRFTVPGPPAILNNKVQCKLEGNDEQWKTINLGDVISWDNVSSGSYSLKVRMQDVDSNWVEVHTPLAVEIKKPLLVSNLAIAVYILIFLSVIVWLNYHYAKRKIAEAEQRAKTAELNAAREDAEIAEFTLMLDSTIMKNISNPDFGSKELEEELCMSRSTLARKMSRYYTITPNDYLKNKRLIAAALMFQNQEMTVKEVSISVGFRTPSYFTKCFKEKYGVSPAEYLDNIAKSQKTL